jgi:MFS family permease
LADTIQSIGALLDAVIMSQLADKMGRRNALVISMIGFSSGLLAALWVRDYSGLVLRRLYLGFFMGAMFSIAVGIYIRDVRPRRARAHRRVGVLYLQPGGICPGLHFGCGLSRRPGLDADALRRCGARSPGAAGLRAGAG